MKEKIKAALEALGFNLEPIDDYGYGFQYEGTNYIWMLNDEDESFLHIAIPGILNKGEVEDKDFFELIDILNSNVKYIKANSVADNIWLFYERDLYDENENLEETLTRMIINLHTSLLFFRKALNDCNADTDNDGSQVTSIEISQHEENTNDE